MRRKSFFAWGIALPWLVASQAFAMTPDLDGDGDDDLLWRHASGAHYAWFMDGTNIEQGSGLGDPTGWTLVGTPDLNGDLTNDLLWRYGGHLVYAWLMGHGTGSPIGHGPVGDPGPDWTLIDTPDLDGDGDDDLLWRHTSGAYFAWLMNGTAIEHGRDLGNPQGWTLVATPDLDGDLTNDLLWRHESGSLYVWLMEYGTGHLSGHGPAGDPGSQWTLIDSPDLDGDGDDDLLWRHTSGTYFAWLMDGTAIEHGRDLGNPQGWTLVATPDLDRNLTNDLLWRHENGSLYAWLMEYGTGHLFGHGPVGNPGTEWNLPRDEESMFCETHHPYPCGEEGPWGECFGPEGALRAITDPSSPFYGVEILIPQATAPWGQCGWLAIEGESDPTPPFPTGFWPFNGRQGNAFVMNAGTVNAGAETGSVYMEMSFPIENISLGFGEIAAAFYYDNAAERWRIVLPDELDDSVMVVKTFVETTQHREYWTWGRVSLYEADYDAYLAPLLEDLPGAKGWSQLETILNYVYDSAFEDATGLSCASVYGVQEHLAGIMAAARARIEDFERNISCGDCRMFEDEAFWDNLREYLSLQIEQVMIEWFLLDSKSIALRLAGMLAILKNWDELRQIPCDYECYYQEANADPAVYAYFVEYLVAATFQYAIELAKALDYITCQTLPVLTVLKDGDGSGTVYGPGIDCGLDCTATLTSGEQVTVGATADEGSQFSHWSGCDSSDGVACHVTMNDHRAVTAYFTGLSWSNFSGTWTGKETVVLSECEERKPEGT